MIDNIASITSRQSTPAVDAFSLQRRNPAGGTKRLAYWGFDNETDPLTDVLLAAPEHLRHMATSSLSRKFLRESPANIEVANSPPRTSTSVCAFMRRFSSPSCRCRCIPATPAS